MLARLLRSFRVALWLGWKVESNWTSPLWFFAFSVLKPIATVLILVFMYRAVAQLGVEAAIYPYVYVGNALYVYVGAVLTGVSFSVLNDRERYGTLKYLYIAPISVPMYLFGRAAAHFLVASIAVVVMMVAGVLLFHVPIQIAQVDWALLLPTFTLGILCFSFLGVVLASSTLTMRVMPWFIGEMLAAALYLVSGAVFPIALLPRFLWPIGVALPTTYWLELIRRSLLGPGALASPPLDRLSNLELFGVLLGLTALLGALTVRAYRSLDRIARERGMIDVQSNL